MNRLTKCLSLIFFMGFFMLILMGLTAFAQTDVSGIISQDTTWNKNGSPYIVKGNLLVDTGATLHITEDVQVLFDGYYYLLVKGKLIAEGSNNHNINFTTNSGINQWDKLNLHNNENVLNYCNFSSAQNAILLSWGCGSNNISNSNFYNNEIAIAFGYSNENNISNCIINNNSLGIKIMTGSDNNIIDCLIDDNENAITSYNYYFEGSNNVSGYGRNNQIIGTSIKNSLNIGVDLSGMVSTNISKCNIINNKTGIYIKRGNNKQYDFLTRINKNNINNNSLYNISTGIDNTEVDCSENYWGNPIESEISSKINDFFDDFNLIKVVYKPFLTTPYGSDLVNSNYPNDKYTNSIDVQLSVTGDGYQIYYTTDGSDPKTNGIKYTVPINISKTTDLKTVSLYNGVYSEVTTYSYQIVLPPPSYTVNSITFTDINQNPVTNFKKGQLLVVNATITKNDSSTTTAMLIMSLYRNNNVYKQMSIGILGLNQNETKTFSVGFTLPNDVDYCKVLLWDSLKGLHPYCSAVRFPKQ